ncbi:MAG: heme ABC transporter ATP-binding protein [Acidimicrobiia bacterium]
MASSHRFTPGDDAVPPLRARAATWLVSGRALVDQVDLDVHAGELVALIGPNGAGKSTLCRLLAGDLEPSTGSVDLFGRPGADHPRRARARLRAVLPQRSSPIAFPALDVVVMGRHPWLRPSAAPGPDDFELATAAMEEVGVGDLADRPFDRLSGGEQARVQLARVLVQQTPVLLLDEPTANLDLRHQHLVVAVARSRADAGVAVVAVLHDVALAAAYADRVVSLDQGRLVACGPPAEVLTGALLSDLYRHPVTTVAHPSQPWDVPVAERLDPGPAPARGGRHSIRSLDTRW